MVEGNKRKIWGYETNLIFQALFTKWHCEGPRCSRLPKHWGCLQTSHLWDGCNAGAIKMTKRWKLKWRMGLLSAFSWGSKNHRDFQWLWISILKWGGGKFVEQNFVILIPAGKKSNVVNSLHWLLILARGPKILCHFENQNDWECDVSLCKANAKLVCWSIHDPRFWIHKQVFEPRVLKYQPDGDQKHWIFTHPANVH